MKVRTTPAHAFVLLSILSFLVAPLAANAASTPTFSNLQAGEAEAIMKNFGNAVAFRSGEPPSANGKIWGFGIGLVFDATSASDVNAVLLARGSAQTVSALPAGDIVLTLQGPLGIGGEIGFLPRKSIGGFSAKRTAFNVKWTFTDLFLRGMTPFDAALRLGFGRNEFAYQQTVNGAADTISFDSKATRLELAMSRRVLFVEPYLGLGWLRTSNTLANTVTVPLYSFTSAHSYDVAKSSFLFNLGAEFRFIWLAAGAGVEWAFGETTATVKLGFKI